VTLTYQVGSLLHCMPGVRGVGDATNLQTGNRHVLTMAAVPSITGGRLRLQQRRTLTMTCSCCWLLQLQVSGCLAIAWWQLHPGGGNP
jgi:hypothetical protein